jgi:hypothetical protein
MIIEIIGLVIVVPFWLVTRVERLGRHHVERVCWCDGWERDSGGRCAKAEGAMPCSHDEDCDKDDRSQATRR